VAPNSAAIQVDVGKITEFVEWTRYALPGKMQETNSRYQKRMKGRKVFRHGMTGFAKGRYCDESSVGASPFVIRSFADGLPTKEGPVKNNQFGAFVTWNPMTKEHPVAPVLVSSWLDNAVSIYPIKFPKSE